MMELDKRRRAVRSVEQVDWERVVSGVVSGVVIGLGLFACLVSFWIALARGSEDGWISGNLAWFGYASAVVALVVAGLVASAFAGVRGMPAGSFNGVAACGVLAVLAVGALVHGATNVTLGLGAKFGASSLAIAQGDSGAGLTAGTALWIGSWSMLVAIVAAVIGGVIGAATRAQHPNWRPIISR